jgi:hypothetical protein
MRSSRNRLGVLIVVLISLCALLLHQHQDAAAQSTTDLVKDPGTWAVTTRSSVLEFQALRALNLDGGPSSGLAWRLPTGEIQTVKQPSLVRNVIEILAR